jgi:hypothetical protein
MDEADGDRMGLELADPSRLEAVSDEASIGGIGVFFGQYEQKRQTSRLVPTRTAHPKLLTKVRRDHTALSPTVR